MSGAARPTLVSHLTGHHTAAVTDAVFVPEAGAVITASADKQVLVWLKRDDSTYWPSVHRFMPAGVTNLCFHEASRTLFVGLENGAISEYEVSPDYNILTSVKGYPAHSSAVTGIAYDAERQQLVSCGSDKTVTLSTTAGNGKRLACVSLPSACMCLQFDAESQSLFIADFSGCIHMYRLENSKLQPMADPLQGHTGSVRALDWSPEKKWLFSGSFDASVILWDFGGKKGDKFALNCHRRRITSIVYLHDEAAILTLSTDGALVLWDLSVERKPVPDWEESDVCQVCKEPFFWNLSKMWEKRSFSVRRQHHCRACGKAVCDDCSKLRCTYPIMGFENATRICDACSETVQASDRTPLAKRFSATASKARARYEPKTKTLVVCCEDGSVKLLNLSPVLAADAKGLAHGTAATTSGAAEDEEDEEERRPSGASRGGRVERKRVTAVVDMTQRPQSDDDDDDDRTDFFDRVVGAEDDDSFQPH